ncbi:MAG: hypothetical protein WB785_21035 [Mycobacterium sp.]|uniref:hypothetical protein n=1 Tax=Mycobacterium sp. TaxID=1785 RepID=UPI003C3C412E
MSLRSQKVCIWWSLIMMVIYCIVLRFNLHMLPPPSARWPATRIAQFYVEHSTEVKLGAVVSSWVSCFMVPLTIVVAVQMYRHEARKAPVWTILTVVGGLLMNLNFVLPSICFGVAAFTPDRAADVTAIMHEFGVISLVTMDQFYIFMWVAVAVICLAPNSVPHSPFARWFGYYTIWSVLMIEAGALAFLFRTGPFAWNGLLAFWSPVIVFFGWIAIATVQLIRAINAQMQEENSQASAVMSAV